MNRYCVMIFQRKKDIPELHKSTVCVHQDLATPEQIRRRLPVYRRIAEELNARIYISASPRNIWEARKLAIVKYVQTEDSEEEPCDPLRQLFSCLMSAPGCERWVVDIDTKEEDVLHAVQYCLQEHAPGSKILATLNTPNGYHLVTEPFDARLLETFDKVEIKKDGFTTIEFPEWLEKH